MSFAPCRSAPLRFAPVRLAPRRSMARQPLRSALVRFAPARFAPRRFPLLRSAFVRFAPARFAPVRFAVVRLLPVRSQPLRLTPGAGVAAQLTPLDPAGPVGPATPWAPVAPWAPARPCGPSAFQERTVSVAPAHRGRRVETQGVGTDHAVRPHTRVVAVRAVGRHHRHRIGDPARNHHTGDDARNQSLQPLAHTALPDLVRALSHKHARKAHIGRPLGLVRDHWISRSRWSPQPPVHMGTAARVACGPGWVVGPSE